MSSAVDRMNYVMQILDEYEASLGLPKYTEEFDNEAGKYLNLSRTQIEKLTYDECVTGVTLLAGLSFHIQRALNRENARIKWANAEIRQEISGTESNYRGSWESQFYQAAMANDYTRAVLKIRNYAEQRAERLSFIAKSIDNIAAALRNVQFSRRNNDAG